MFDHPTVVIMSGLPGSGKSTYAYNCRSQYCFQVPPYRMEYVSADDFWYDSFGGYNFDASKLQEAHSYCFREFIRLCEGEYDEIIVDNCGSKLHDVSPYILAAQAYGYDYLIVCCNASVETCLSRQTHNVPEHTIRNMEKNLYDMYAKLPIGWKAHHIDTN